MTVDVSQFTPLIAQTPAVNEGVHYDNARRIEASFGQERALRDVTRDTVRRDSVSLQLSEQATRIPAPSSPNTSAAPAASPVTTNSAGLVDITG
ncbi:MAG: hypothetical protein AAF684_01205 [Pseudomonadota bacterium]